MAVTIIKSASPLGGQIYAPDLSEQHQSMLLQMEFYRLHYPLIYARIIKQLQVKKPAGMPLSDDMDGNLGRWGVISRVEGAIKKAGSQAVSIAKTVVKDSIDPRQIIKNMSVPFVTDAVTKLAQSKIVGQVVHAVGQANPTAIFLKAVVPKNIQASAQTFDSQHRTEIKIAGAAAAIVAGGYALAPTLMSGLATSITTEALPALQTIGTNIAKSVATTAAIKAISKTGVSPKAAAALTQVGAAAAGDPTAQGLGNALGDQVATYINQVGTQKAQQIAQQVLGDKPLTGADDPRLAQIAAALQQARGSQVSPDVTSAVASAHQANAVASSGFHISPALLGGLGLLLVLL